MSCEDFTDKEGWDKVFDKVRTQELVDKARIQIFEAYELLKEAMKCLEKK